MRTGRRLRDERGIITGSLVRYVAILAILGLAVIEAGSILYTYIRLQNAADAAAVVAADAWQDTSDIRQARRTVRDELDTRGQDDATITGFEGDAPPTYEIRFTAEKEAATLIVRNLGFLEDLGVVEVEAVARPVEAGV